jgi:hypothetical protein
MNLNSRIVWLLMMIIFGIGASAHQASARGIIQAPMPTYPCPSGSVNMVGSDDHLICSTSFDSDSTGVMLIGAGATYEPGIASTAFGAFSNAYVVVPGIYTDRIYICATNTASKCTIKNSNDSIDGANAVNLNTASLIIVQGFNAGGPAVKKTINYSFSICQVLVDSRGTEWRSDDATSCSDGKIFPDHPSVCTINEGLDLDIALGQLERSAITTTPTMGASGNIKKSLSVSCDGDLATTVKTQFQYTPIAVSNNQVVSTSNSNLGVAIIYKGSVVSPTDAFTETY